MVDSLFLSQDAGDPTQGWQGSLQLRLANRHGKTQPIHTLVQAPLKVQRPFYPEANVCHSVVLHTAGGMVGGDRLNQVIHLEANAHALLTTAAAGKVYRSSGKQAQQQIQIYIDAGACLEWLPQETIIFNGAVFRQDLRVELAPSGSWLGWEITRFGRSARGEKFLQGEWRSNIEVWQEGNPLWIDRQWLPASEEIFNSPHGLARQPVVASLVWIGQDVSSEFIEKVRILRKAKQYQGEADVSALISGLLCRYRGSSTVEARNWLTEVWQLLRRSFLKLPITKPRVWF